MSICTTCNKSFNSVITSTNEENLCTTCHVYTHYKSVKEQAVHLDDLLIQNIKGLGSVVVPKKEMDYYINAQGLYVFTQWYLLRRGYCCQNGCMHCPYGFVKESNE